ncbi:MAG: UDP-N-acetylmuramate--L-alanine ligase [Spirochaetes bacterium]|nr:UDP-N-acetylmuramate--L-alanine ligase [Spirochaetota bacterium]
MPEFKLASSFGGIHAHFVGAKGTGMAALAELFAARGAVLSGSDVPDHFYTDAVLDSIGMKLYEGFSKGNLDPSIDLVLYSDAYRKDQNPELIEASGRGIPTMSYAEALGAFSRTTSSSGICGVHGKTTTTALAGSILKELNLPATVIAGSAVSSFGGSCIYLGGDKYFVAETDEYRGHFLNFSPNQILLTSVESDHQDFYPTYKDILAAFVIFIGSLPPGGRLVYCADDPGAREAAQKVLASRPDIIAEPYGFSAEGDWGITGEETVEGLSRFKVRAWDGEFELHLPGRHLVMDAVGAIALTRPIYLGQSNDKDRAGFWKGAREALGSFAGSKRRSEVLGSAAGVLFVDDYAHHPTALRTTIAGYKTFWSSRRLIVDFMSHTYSRTIALMDEFAASFGDVDCLILHDIYASARETRVESVSGLDLFEKVRAARPDLVDISPLFSEDESAPPDAEVFERLCDDPRGFILYTRRHQDAAAFIQWLLRPGDLFATMGAGDNWKLGTELLSKLKGRLEPNV